MVGLRAFVNGGVVRLLDMFGGHVGLPQDAVAVGGRLELLVSIRQIRVLVGHPGFSLHHSVLNS